MLRASQLLVIPATVTDQIRSPSLRMSSSEVSSSSKPSMERCSVRGEKLRRAGMDVHRVDLKAEMVWAERVRGNHALTGGSGGLADILTRMSLNISRHCQSLG